MEHIYTNTEDCKRVMAGFALGDALSFLALLNFNPWMKGDITLSLTCQFAVVQLQATERVGAV